MRPTAVNDFNPIGFAAGALAALVLAPIVVPPLLLPLVMKSLPAQRRTQDCRALARSVWTVCQ